MFIFLSISLNICFGCSKEPSLDETVLLSTHIMFWLQINKMNFCLHTYLGNKGTGREFFQTNSTGDSFISGETAALNG